MIKKCKGKVVLTATVIGLSILTITQMKVLSAPPGQNRSTATGNIISIGKHQSKLFTKVKNILNKELKNNWIFGSKEKYKKLEEKLLNYVIKMILNFWDAYYNINKNIKDIENASSYGSFGIKVTYKAAEAYNSAVQFSDTAKEVFPHIIGESLYNIIYSIIHKKVDGITEFIPDYKRDYVFYESLCKAMSKAIIDNSKFQIKIDDKNYYTIDSKKYFENLANVLVEQTKKLLDASNQLISSGNNSSSSSSSSSSSNR